MTLPPIACTWSALCRLGWWSQRVIYKSCKVLAKFYPVATYQCPYGNHLEMPDNQYWCRSETSLKQMLLFMPNRFVNLSCVQNYRSMANLPSSSDYRGFIGDCDSSGEIKGCRTERGWQIIWFCCLKKCNIAKYPIPAAVNEIQFNHINFKKAP